MSRSSATASIGGFSVGLSAIYNRLTDFSDAISVVTNSLVTLTGGGLDRVVDSIGAVVSQSRAFVSALSPALLQVFDLQLRNLMATIGTGLVPIFNVLTDVVKQVSSIIYPAIQKLAPIIELLANSIGSLLIGAVENLVAVFELLEPVIRLFAEGIQIISAVFRVAQATFAAIIQTLSGLFARSGIQNWLTSLVDGIKTVVKELIRFSALISSAFYGLEFINKIIANIQRPTGSHPVAAPQGIGVHTLEQIGKDLAIASLAAGGGQKQTDDFLADILGVLQEVRDQGPLTIQDLFDGLSEYLDTIVGGVTDWTIAALAKFWEWVKEWWERLSRGVAEDVVSAGQSPGLWVWEALRPNQGRIGGDPRWIGARGPAPRPDEG